MQVEAYPTEDGFEEIFTHPPANEPVISTDDNPYLNHRHHDQDDDVEPLTMFLSLSMPAYNNIVKKEKEK